MKIGDENYKGAIMDFETIKPLLREGQKSKIVLLVMDGLGGLPIEEGG